jgi:hypothetical protein
VSSGVLSFLNIESPLLGTPNHGADAADALEERSAAPCWASTAPAVSMQRPIRTVNRWPIELDATAKTELSIVDCRLSIYRLIWADFSN